MMKEKKVIKTFDSSCHFIYLVFHNLKVVKDDEKREKLMKF